MKRFVSAYVLCAIFLFAPVESFAAMQSANYRIYETLPDGGQAAGPVISAVNAAAITGSGATITWQTNEQSDSYVVYGTDPGFADSFEYGLASLTGPNHSVVLSSLAANTKYYYQVKSTNSAGGTTLKNDGASFTTAASSASAVMSSGGGGGGIIYIDSSDKAAPVISDFDVTDLTAGGARAVWKTSEPANSFVRIALPDGRVRIFGHWDSVLVHQVEITDCAPQTRYNFDAISTDQAGNTAVSSRHFFKTLEAPAKPQPIKPLEQTLIQAKSQMTPSAVVYAPQKPLPFQGAGSAVTRGGRENEPMTGKSLPVEKAATSVSQNPVRKSEVVESKELKISNFDFVIVRAEDVIFRWLTNFPADTRISLVPKTDGQLLLERAIEYSAKAYSLHHQAEFKNLEVGVTYEVRLFGRDKKGILATQTVNDFSAGSTIQKPAKAVSALEKNGTSWTSSVASRLRQGVETVIAKIVASVRSFFGKFIK